MTVAGRNARTASRRRGRLDGALAGQVERLVQRADEVVPLPGAVAPGGATSSIACGGSVFGRS